MDVGYFICELLGQHGEVSVPGLGYFAHTRVNGYYNEAEDTFYPPSYSVQFDPQVSDDETLAQYIADKKNISLASSRYFTDKYVNQIKQQAANGEVALGNMGWFYTSQLQLAFRPNNSLNADPEFFGYPAIKMGKPVAQEQIVTQPKEANEPSGVPEPTTGEPELETDAEQDEYLARKKRNRSILTFVICAVLFAGIVAFLLYRYSPSRLGINKPTHNAANKPAPPQPKIAAADTGKADTAAKVKPDTLARPPVVLSGDTAKAIAADSIPYPRWEVIGGSFKFKKEANAAVAGYKARGITARIATEIPGPRFKIGLGTYATQVTANKAVRALKKTKKVKEDIYPLKINKK